VELPRSAITVADAAEVAGGQIRGDAGVAVREAAYDSREVPAGAMFFCIPGGTADGHAFAADALAAGAVAIVVERWLGLDAPQVLVPSVRRANGPMSSAIFGHPARALTTVGVTGTNGKTTTTFLLEAAFRRLGLRPGVIGTTGARLDGEPIPLDRTTPEAPDLQRLLARMREAGVRAVAMEVSSHALAQDRVGGLRFDVAAFTNLTRDHLDLHASMEGYFAAKAGLFTPTHAVRAVVNADDSWGRRLLEAPHVPTATFAVDRDADLRATNVIADAAGLAFGCEGIEVRSHLRGRFNVTNCLAALAAVGALGLDVPTAALGLGDVAQVPGRMESIEAGQDFLVVVDYAHTPDSIRNVLRGARSLADGRVLIVFGCGGDRDRDKRPEMGRVATTEADLAIITDDNPRSEDPAAIIEQIRAGARDGAGAFLVERDRRRAIRTAFAEARSGDIVVIAGKGHEPYQEVGGRLVPFDDRSVAREELASVREDA
jgi:UDP-N-acetylmuramoyl-L-alanyl-D-glutamate--2,6-diaminopimelate ligase